MSTREDNHMYSALKNKPLNYFQTTYLRLFVHDYTDKEIAQFLEVSSRRVLSIQKSITNKFGTQDWNKILFMAFKFEILKHPDYVEDSIKTEAREFTNKIFIKNIVSSPSPFWPQNSIRKLIVDFNKSCEQLYLKEARTLPKLRKTLKTLLNLLYCGKREEFIIQEMRLSNDEYQALEQELLDYFSVNRIFNAIQKGFRYGYIDHDSNYIVGKHADILNKTIDSISSLRTLNLKSNKLHKLYIYDSLLEYYGLYENYILFKEKWNTSAKENKIPEVKMDLVFNFRNISYGISV
jgi:hypothetical protein